MNHPRDSYRVRSREYLRNPFGGYVAYSLAFLQYCQWQDLVSPQHNGKRGGNKPLGARNYAVWPLFTEVR